VPKDRAAVVTTAILQVVVSALRQWLNERGVGLSAVRVEVENILREEFADVARVARDERELPDE